jgi:nucleoside-diphosphate-sugar epimerase
MSLGEQLRDFLPIEDVADILVQIAMKNMSVSTINIASGKPISVKEIVKEWIEFNNWKIKQNLGYYPYSPFEPMQFWGDTTNLKKIINS